MGKGIIKINTEHASEWFALGFSKNDTQTLLKLPVHYQIEDIHADDRDNTLSITVSADDIPDSADLQATYVAVEGYSKGVWEDPESYRLADLKATYSLPLDHPVPDQKKGTGEEEKRPRDE